MPLSNEAEIKDIIVKLFKSIEAEYMEASAGTSYYYLNYITDGNAVAKAASSCLSEADLTLFVGALAENEIEVNRLISENFSLEKFFNKIKKNNIKPISTEIIRAYKNLQFNKKVRANQAKKARENMSLYRAARLTARQKQVLHSLGLNLSSFESPP